MDKDSALNIVFHILRGGKALCGFSKKTPDDWPSHHQWVGIKDGALANCPGCVRIFKSLGDCEELKA